MTTTLQATTTLRPLSAHAIQAQHEITEAGRYLLEFGALAPAGRSGAFNGGIRLPDSDHFVIASRGGAIEVSLSGQHLAGEPNRGLIEVIEIYASVFRERPDLNAIIHTHSPNLTAYAIAHKPFPLRYWSVAKRAGVDEIPLGDWAPRYAAEPVLASLRKAPSAPAVLLRNRGLFAWGKEGVLALARQLASLEEAAEITLKAEVLGGPQPLPEGAIANFIAAKRG
ncbi:class II aldolase/adducin family protein [Rheinheimera muenzenbergensis]|uniref:Class II aldolase/adducin family protein n=1 Tax=Rheinheimera muenzenbergensis TaxID=1193628 RepID=A0ABU8C428_9GAMM